MKRSEEKLNIRDPIYGFISLDEIEKELIQTLPFQRLRFIRQLGNSFWVYPSASHSRFEHSLGVFHLSKKILKRLKEEGCHNLTEEDEESFKLASLLHDIGHTPFSHAGERFEGKPLFKNVKNHDIMGAKIIQEQGEIKDILNRYSNKNVLKKISFIMGGSNEPITPNDTLLHDLLTGHVGIDRIDYLLRDSYTLGVMYGKFDLERILETFRYEKDKEVDIQTFDKQIGGTPVYWESGGIRALEQFVIARYLMYSEVYLHKNRRILDYHLSHLIKSYLEKEIGDGYYPDNVDEFVKITDAQIINFLPESRYRDIFLKRKFYKLVPVDDNIYFNRADLIIWDGLIEKLNDKYPERFYFDEETEPIKSSTINVEMNGEIRPIRQVSKLVNSLENLMIRRLYALSEKVEEIASFSKKYIQDKRAIYQSIFNKNE